MKKTLVRLQVVAVSSLASAEGKGNSIGIYLPEVFVLSQLLFFFFLDSDFNFGEEK